MAYFLIFTLISLLATASFAKILFFSIQHGQWLDAAFNWQTRLRKWDEQGKYILSKPLGLCEMCYSNFLALLSLPFYMAFMYGFNIWLPEGVVVNILWILGYHSISVVLNLYFLVRLFDK